MCSYKSRRYVNICLGYDLLSNLAAVTPVKYECDSQKLQMWKWLFSLTNNQHIVA